MDERSIKKVAVVGAGVMGHSIAQVYAAGGFEVTLMDVSEAGLARARALIESNLSTLVEFGSLSRDGADRALKRIKTTVDLAEAVKGAQLVVEAVNENPDVKKKVFSQIDGAAPPDAVIASNTSGLNVFTIAEISNPERLVIHHWFAPPHIIPLVEVVPGPKTAPGLVDFSVKLLERLGKKPVVLKEFVPSFIVNRIQAYIALAFYDILNNGWATPEAIDLAVKTSLGVRLPVVGVVQSQDFTGLDLVRDVAKGYGQTIPVVEERVQRGDLGAKSGRGFYDYGGRSEAEVLRKRDLLYLKTLEFLEKNRAFEPV
jgi:3-hydroxybutyryl-CoA dehydrogenase